jgi:hypothetical protein
MGIPGMVEHPETLQIPLPVLFIAGQGIVGIHLVLLLLVSP